MRGSVQSIIIETLFDKGIKQNAEYYVYSKGQIE